MLGRRGRWILAAASVVVGVVAFFLLRPEYRWVGIAMIVLAVLSVVITPLATLAIAGRYRRVREQSGAPVAAAVYARGPEQRARLADLIGAAVPKDGQVILAPTPAALEAWTATRRPSLIVAAPWLRLGPVSMPGRGFLWQSVEFSYVSNERVHGVARLMLIAEGADPNSYAIARRFVDGLNAVRPPVQ